MNGIGPYWSVMHRRPQDYDYFRRLNPAVFKLMDAGPPDYAWVRANLPNALVVARIHSLSEQHSDMARDPVGTGKRHAQEWAQHTPRLGFDRARTLVLGTNEPRVWQPDMLAAVVPYTVAFCDECARLGLRAGALQLGVGWPANTGPDTPPDWGPYAPVEAAIKRGNHALICHEYWADAGPGENWGWWAGRSLKCPWDVPIVIGECGIDMYVKDASVEHNRRGWQGRVSPERYAQELAEYTSRMSADPRFVGCCVFASDFANREWASFDVEPAYQAILATPIPQPQPSGTDSTVYIPVVGSGPSQPQPQEGSMDNWQRSRAFVKKWEGGFQDYDWDLGNWTGCKVGVGEKKGTKYGISACSYPHLDIRNITEAQADDIYRRDYWQASGADKLPWPACLIVFDTAILHGVGTARAWLAEAGTHPYLFAAKRLRVYPKLAAWPQAGAAWVARVADLLVAAAK